MDTRELNLMLTDSFSSHLVRQSAAAESICGEILQLVLVHV